jgi:hypothetical protein
MLLKIYLGISIATVILFVLEMWKIEHEIKVRHKNFKPKTDKVGLLFTYIKLVILCFIPIFNIIWFSYIAYCFLIDDSILVNKDEIDKAVAKKIKEDEDNG